MKGAKNEDYWKALKYGRSIPEPAKPFVHNKFFNLLKSSGINISRKGDVLSILPMSDKAADKLTGGRFITSSGHVDNKFNVVKGGLFDDSLTGGLAGKKWSAVKLHEPIPNPVMEVPIQKLLNITAKEFRGILTGTKQLHGKTGGAAIKEALRGIDVSKAIEEHRKHIKTARGASRDASIKALGYLAAAKSSGVHPSEWVMSSVPVIPPVFRPITKAGNMTMVNDMNTLYTDLVESNSQVTELSKELGPEDLQEEKGRVYDAMKAVFGLGQPVNPEGRAKGLKGGIKILTGDQAKHGFIQSKLLSKPTDAVGRAVIVPDPDLDMDSVGIPDEKAWELYKPFVTRRLTKKGYTPERALRAIEEKSQVAEEALDAEMDHRLVFLDRAPTWHKFNFMAFKPHRVKGHTLHVSPLITTGFNADFDGDFNLGTILIGIKRGGNGDFDKVVDKTRKLCYNKYSDEKYDFNFFNRRKVMSFTDLNISCQDDYSFYVVDLADVPYLEHGFVGTTKSGNADIFEVPPGLKVIAINEDTGKPELADIKYWSRHRDREVWTVTLKNKKQTFADDDERAVYGIDTGTLEYVRRSPAAAIGIMVPMVKGSSSLYTDGFLELAINPKEGIQGTEKPLYANNYILHDVVKLDSDTGYFLGGAAGDGWTIHWDGIAQGIAYAGIQREITDKFKRVTSKLFETPAEQLMWRETTNNTSYGKSLKHSLGSRALGEWLESMIGCGAANKHLPPFWHRTSREFRIGLLSGLLDSDGSVSVSNGKAKPQLMANICSNSLRMLREVQQLLRSIDITSRITFAKTTSAGNDNWTLGISSVGLCSIKDELVCVKPKIAESLNAVNPDPCSPSAVRQDLVPITLNIATKLAKAEYATCTRRSEKTKKIMGSSLYVVLKKAGKDGYITREAAKQALAKFPDLNLNPRWLDMVANEEVTWSPVVEVENTGKVEVGYDLTVPGYETFMSTDGIILSNTMAFHVPVGDKAVAQAKEKMMPSSNLFQTSTLNKIISKPEKEFAMGLYLATNRQSKKQPTVFNTVRDAKIAYRKGELDLSDPVVIKGS